jgi:hypothetical protein
LWFNHASLSKKALMEKSKLVHGWQRTRKWCEPGQPGWLKIIPELQSEPGSEIQEIPCS